MFVLSQNTLHDAPGRISVIGKTISACSVIRVCLGLTCSVVFGGIISTASATALNDSFTLRPNFVFPAGDPVKSSYDGLNNDAFKPFSSSVAEQVFALNSFSGLQAGSDLQFTLLSEAAAFDGSAPGFANNIGVVDENGQFISALNSAQSAPGATASLSQGANQLFTIALQSPEGLFTSIDSQNEDKASHILVRQVEQNGQVLVSPTDVRGGPALSFNLLAGDLILFIEDMRAVGNIGFLSVPGIGDFDYNDVVVLVRQSPVPEPATLLLLGGGLAALSRRKFRKTASSV